MKNLILIIIIALTSCSPTTTNSPSKKKTINKKRDKIEIQITHNKNNYITIGEKVSFEYSIKNHTTPDSIKVLSDFKLYNIFHGKDSIIWNSINENTGKKQLKFTFYWGDTVSTSKTINFELLSNIKPKHYKFKTINRWPHSNGAYTQGLEFSDGYLYEGTGNYGKSMLYKIDLNKNEILQSVNLHKEVFGEGITILNDKLYQLTWRSNIGYVYDKNSLNKLYDFNYPTEGWGLTNNGTELIMSDGSENIYFLDTEFIQETRRIQVYDNKIPIKNLNELEYIDGLIYANIYGTNNIVAFESKTGKVIKHINLTGILNKKDIKSPIDVLNGIAWDNNHNRLIVTGKWWPYFYEIELVGNNN